MLLGAWNLLVQFGDFAPLMLIFARRLTIETLDFELESAGVAVGT